MKNPLPKLCSCITIASLSLLTSCAHINEQAALPKSTGRVPVSQQLTTAQVSLTIPAASEINISKSDRTQPWISETDKLVASNHIKSLTTALLRGVKDRLPIIASKYALSLTNNQQATPELRISVISSNMSCSKDSCSYWLELSCEIFSEKGDLTWASKPLMAISGESKTTYTNAFDDFAKKLLDAMKRDQLLR